MAKEKWEKPSRWRTFSSSSSSSSSSSVKLFVAHASKKKCLFFREKPACCKAASLYMRVCANLMFVCYRTLLRLFKSPRPALDYFSTRNTSTPDRSRLQLYSRTRFSPPTRFRRALCFVRWPTRGARAWLIPRWDRIDARRGRRV